MRSETYRFREYRIAPDTEPDAKPTTFAMQCDVCGTASEPSDSAAEPTSWAAEHLKGCPDHLSYTEVISRPYFAVPGEFL